MKVHGPQESNLKSIRKRTNEAFMLNIGKVMITKKMKEIDDNAQT